MYKATFILAFLLNLHCLVAQTDADSAIETDSTPPRERNLDRYASAYRLQAPLHCWFKWDVMALLPSQNYYTRDNLHFWDLYSDKVPVAAGFEWKIKRYFALNAQLGFGRSVENYAVKLWVAAYSIEPRFYFELPFSEKRKQQADNFSGNYVGFEVRKQFGYTRAALVYDFELTNTLRVGMSRRSQRLGWLDASIGIGKRGNRAFDHSTGFVTPNWRAVLDPRLSFGLAIGEMTRKDKQDRKHKVRIFSTLFDEPLLKKLDVLGLLVPHKEGVHGRISYAWEWAIGKAVSTELDLFIPYKSSPSSSNIIKNDNGRIGIGAGLSPRWYLLKPLQQRAQKPNGMLGIFAGYHVRVAKWTTGEWDVKRSPVIGVQSRLFERAYCSYQLGFGKTNTKIRSVSGYPNYDYVFSKEKYKHLFLELQVGLLF